MVDDIAVGVADDVGVGVEESVAVSEEVFDVSRLSVGADEAAALVAAWF